MKGNNGHVVAVVLRYETECCGFLFNRPVEADSEYDGPQTAHIYGEGSYVVGECPGCRKQSPRANLIAPAGSE